MSNFLVTGGAGFIGSNLVGALIARGHSVRVLDNFSSGKRSNLNDYAGKIEVVEGDLTILSDVQNAVRDIEVVLHHGAKPSVQKSIDDPVDANLSNVNGTLHVLVAARDAGVRRVIYASSSSVYGEQDPSTPKAEMLASMPISPYAVSKLAAEHYCQVFHHVYGLETVSLRYFNVFGPRQDPNSMYAAVIPRFVTAFLRGEAPVIYGDGEQTRDFTYIENVVEGNILAANAPVAKVGGRVFNLAAGGRTSLNTLIEMLQEIVGSTLSPIYEEPRPGDIRHSQADISQAHHALGYEPSISVHEGLRLTTEWYRNQK